MSIISTVYLLYRKVKFKLLLIIRKKVIIPSYEFKRDEINKFINQYNLDVLVETGTFQGDTVEYFKNKIAHVFSIELSEDFAEKAKRRFSLSTNVKILQGDSGHILKSLIPEINQDTLFWLDGHYSSEFYIGDEYFVTAKGELNTPIIEELKCILKHQRQHVILIDDARLYVGTNDYPTITQIRKLIQSTNNNYHLSVKNDIIYILPNAKATTKF